MTVPTSLADFPLRLDRGEGQGEVSNFARCFDGHPCSEIWDRHLRLRLGSCARALVLQSRWRRDRMWPIPRSPQDRAAGTDSQKTPNIQRRTSYWAQVDAALEAGCSMFTRRVGSTRWADRTSQRGVLSFLEFRQSETISTASPQSP